MTEATDRNRIRFHLRTKDDRFTCEARGEWRELDEAYRLLVVELRRHDGLVYSLDEVAQVCGITRRSLELQLRVCAIYADRERELNPGACPVAWIACGPVTDAKEPIVLEGRLVA